MYVRSIVKKLLLAIITLILAVATFTGVTFAWLSINSDAWVEGMQIQATAGKGFLVSVDGYNYSSNIAKEDIVKAIIIKYRKTYSLDSKGNLLDENNQEISDKEMMEIFGEIELEPCTSYDSTNLELTNVLGTKVDASKGEFIEFDLYFKSTGELTKNIDIYLNGLDKVLHQDTEDIQVNPTKFSSGIDEVKLVEDLITINKETNESIQMKEDDILKVKSLNASRLGIINQQGEISIIELTDEYDLGSYATNIKDYITPENDLYDANIEYNAMYDAYTNAMFTYSSQLEDILTPLDYKKIPKTIKSLVDGQGLNTVKVCTLTKTESVQKVTFRFWLEGWDADCIDGLSKSISVQLSFVQQ